MLARLGKQIPILRNYIGPDGRLSDGSHRFAMAMLTGNPDATTKDLTSTGPIPDSVKVQGFPITTHWNYPIEIVDNGKVIGRTDIRVSSNPEPKKISA